MFGTHKRAKSIFLSNHIAIMSFYICKDNVLKASLRGIFKNICYGKNAFLVKTYKLIARIHFMNYKV